MSSFERQLEAWLDQEWAEHVATDLELLSRIPSGGARHFIDYFRSLSQEDRRQLISGLKYRTHATLAPVKRPAVREAYRNPPSLQAFYDHRLENGWRWQYLGIRSKKLSAAAPALGGPQSYYPPEQLVEAQRIESAKAAQLRSSLRTHLKGMFPGKPENWGGGQWVYRKQLAGELEFLLLDYGGRGDQIRYNVGLQKGSERWPGVGVSYEQLLSFAFGGWDQIEAGRIEDAMSLMVELIIRIESLFERVVPFLRLGSESA